jgi:preprotein translocase subunit YajC
MISTVASGAAMPAMAVPPSHAAPGAWWPDVAGVVVAMAAGSDQVSPWVQLVPFALVLAIFYFVILLPMKRRQKKVQEFIEALKVGDKVVTTGGILGSITKISEQSFQLQIAPNVRVDISRGAIVGYQGQPPVADQHS